MVGRGGVVEGERVAGALADAALEADARGAAGADVADGAAADPLLPAGAVAAAEEPDEADRLELEGAPLRIDGAPPRPAEEPVNSDAGSAAGLSPRVAERKPRGSSRSPPIARGAKVRSARGTMASDRDGGAAAPPPEVSRSSAGNGSSPVIAPGSAIALSSRIVPPESLSRASASESAEGSAAPSRSLGASSRSGRPEKGGASNEGRPGSAPCNARSSSLAAFSAAVDSPSGNSELSKRRASRS